MPPRFGYQKLFTSSGVGSPSYWCRRVFFAAAHRDGSEMRCEAQSAEIWRALMPQAFSV